MVNQPADDIPADATSGPDGLSTASNGGVNHLTVPDPRPWPESTRSRILALRAMCDERERARRRTPSAARRTRDAEALRTELLAKVESWDRADPMFRAIQDLADQMTRRAEFPIPHEWFEDIEWFRAGLTQLIGQPTKPDAFVILHPGASRISRMSFRWDYEDAYFLCVHEIEPEDLAWEQANL